MAARFLLATCGALAVAGGAVIMTAEASGIRTAPVAATASTPGTTTPGNSTQGDSTKTPASPSTASARDAACSAYLKHLSTRLGTPQPKLEKAMRDAAADTLKDQVAKGTLTQAQADEISKRLAAGSLCSAAALGRHGGHGSGEGPKARGPHVTGGYLEAAAAALNLPVETLKKDLKDGQTLSQLAAAQNLSEDDFKAKVRASIKVKLDAKVAAGKLTQAREDEMLARLTAGDPPLWNGKPAHR